jgi:hypothetical protein
MPDFTKITSPLFLPEIGEKGVRDDIYQYQHDRKGTDT